MEIKEVITSKTVYIAKHGGKFYSKESCSEYELRLVSLYSRIMCCLQENNKNPNEVLFVVIDGKTTNFNSFCEKAKNSWTNDANWCIHINETLKIVGDKWWLDVRDYDSHNYLEYNELPLIGNYPQCTNVEEIIL